MLQEWSAGAAHTVEAAESFVTDGALIFEPLLRLTRDLDSGTHKDLVRAAIRVAVEERAEAEARG